MAGPNQVGSAFIRIRPDVSQFASELERRIAPQIAAVQRQVDRAFARSGGAGFQRAGQVAGEAFTSSFGRSVSGLIVPADLAVQQAGRRVKATAEKVGAEAGKAMGQQTGRRFQEGFEALAAFAIASRIGRFFSDTAQIAIEFERAFAGVRRVVPGTAEDLSELQDSIRGLAEELPFTTVEIANVVQQSAQLGVAREDLLGFAETILKVSAATNLSTEQAAAGLARFAAVMRLPLIQIEPLASALIELGNTSGVVESEILEVGTSLASIGVPLGVSSDQILALSAAMRRVGGDFEAGGSAIRQAINNLRQAARRGGDDFDILAQSLDVSVEELRRLATEAPAEAFVTLLEGLNRAGDASIDILDRLGLSQIRFSRELGKMATGVEFFSQNLATSNTAFRENTALTEEFGIFAGIAANRIQVLRNQIENTRESLGRGLIVPLEAGVKAMASLQESSVILLASLAGITAVAFAYSRFSRILTAEVIPAMDRLFVSSTTATGAIKGMALAELEANEAFAAGTTRAGAFLKALGQVAVVSVAVDLFNQLGEDVRELTKDMQFGAENIPAATQALLDFSEGTATTAEVFDKARVQLGGVADQFTTLVTEMFQIGRFASLESALDPGLIDQFQDAITSVTGQIPGMNTVLEEGRDRFEELDQAFKSLLQTLGTEEARTIFEQFVADLEAGGLGQAREQLLLFLDDFVSSVNSSTVETQALEKAQRRAADASIEQGLAVRLASGDLFTFAEASETARAALSFLTNVSQEFDQRVEAFTAPFGQTLLQESDKAAKAGRKAGDAARRVADAERDLAQAREDAAERIADAERKLAEAEEEAIERVLEARRRLEQTRFEGRRRIRDATQELHDFEAALARAGGAQTPEDLIRLRELREAVSDARADNTRSVREGLRDVKDAEEEGREAVIEAQRRLAEAHEEAAEKIEEASRRIQDAQRKSGEAAGAAAENIIDTINELVNSFRTDARLLEEFSTLMDQAATRVFSAFGDQEVGEAFLAGLVEMGVEAIPILRDLVNDMDRGELKRLEKVFSDRIKGAKKAADFQFDKFPDNWTEKMFAARKAAGKELEKFISQFDQFPEHTSPGAAAAEADLIAFGNVLESMVTDGLVQLDLMETGLLEVGTDGAQPSLTRIEALRTLMGKLKAPKLNLGVNTDPAFKDLTEFLDALEAGVEGKLQVSFGGRTFRQHGGFLAAGQPAIVGETGKEFFIPNTDGTVLPHQLTERILSALSRFGGTRGGVIQYITVNEVANDPIATARSVSWAVGQGAIR